jgi:dTDP-4-amino-4,6-dideoxygalactose transaminase
MKRLGEAGIECGLYYRTPLHLHPAYRRYGYREGDMPVAEAIGSQVLSLPMHPYLEDEEVDEVSRAILSFEQ